MRLIHTADWHLGLSFHNYSRLEEQALFLQWLEDLVARERVDALLVAGDVFDTYTPSSQAQNLFYQFLHRVTERCPKLSVVVTAGNHDSGLRLEAPKELLAGLNIHLKGSVVQNQTERRIDYQQFAIPLRDAQGREFLCLAIPFLRINDCPQNGDAEDPTVAFYRELAEDLATDPRPKICLGHLYASSSHIDEHDEVEYSIIGGLDGLPLEPYLRDYRYVALGHIHIQQRVYATGTVYYAGAPIATTFAHQGRHTGVLLVDVTEQGTTVTPIDFPSPLHLLRLAGRYQEIEAAITALPQGEPDALSPILAVEIVTEEPIPFLKTDLERWFMGRAARLGPVVLRRSTEDDRTQEDDSLLHFYHGLDAEQIAQREYRKNYGIPMPEKMLGLFREAIQQAREGEPKEL